MSTVYRTRPAHDFRVGESGAVLQCARALVFACPCAIRDVYLPTPPHKYTVDADGKLTLSGDVISEALFYADGSERRAAGWCRFTVRSGEARMHDGAQCPGATRFAGEPRQESLYDSI